MALQQRMTIALDELGRDGELVVTTAIARDGSRRTRLTARKTGQDRIAHLAGRRLEQQSTRDPRGGQKRPAVKTASLLLEQDREFHHA